MPSDPGAEPARSVALRNWRVRTRLIALILVPTIVAVLLGGLRVATSIQSAAEYERVRTVAEFVTIVGDLVHQLDLERDLSGRFVANGRQGNEAKRLIRDQQNVVDGAVRNVLDRKDAMRSAFGDIGLQEFNAVVDRLAGLRVLRASAVESQLPALPTLQKYNLLIDDLLALFDETGRGSTDETLAASATALASLARSAEQLSRQRGTVSIALIGRRFDRALLDAFNTAKAQQISELNSFFSRATPAQRQAYSDTVSSPKADVAAGLVERILFLTDEGAPLRGLGTRGTSDVGFWFESSSDGLNRTHQAEQALGRTIVDRAQELARGEQGQAAVNIAVVAVLLVLVLIITIVMARSLVTPLRRLRREALEIAGHRLPDLVQKLRESEGNTGPPEVRPIGVTSADEVGEVARAFDEVHREAIRLANDEAQLRSNVSAMFVNLSRRTQTLVERQISLIDGLEQGEQDDKRLGDLFRLDHLATRMRRNSENLLVLAGQEPARRWSRPVPLLDVTRASLSEVENYERVTMNVPTGVSVVGQAVNDVIHLLAELVENAISFSPRETRVTMRAGRIEDGGVMISITDAGIGMTDEELAQTNWRLANPPVVDVSVSRRMGLFVVGRLALRNGIRVQLRRHDAGGLTAMVLLPGSLIGTPAGPGAVAPDGQAFGASGAPAWAGAGQNLFAGTFDSPVSPGSVGGLDSPAVSGSFGDQPPFGAPNGLGPLGPTTGGGYGPNTGSGRGGSPNGAGGFHGPATGGFGGPPTGPGGPHTGPATGSGGFGGPASGPGGYGGPATGGGLFGGPPTGPGAGEHDREVRQRRRRHDTSELEAVTGPLPAVDSSAEQREEFLPIFASVESAWFRRVDHKDDKEKPDGTWDENPADAGWQAAAAVQEPARDGTTAAGLPKRVPKANLVPGSAATAGPSASPAPAGPALSPDRARSRLSSFQRGVREGRAVARGEMSEDEVGFKAESWRIQGDKEDK
ncbi:sensor histidine kinase [Sphaerisporangium fuscum]|uniref:sensor histidine kinase n=1 Tax=Sphaerisporangium fuscum TaxID=2835868 RepID=UPI001BDCE095|nr:nitrate- and nitrite sensing domain-containing protein [Sphaerisporangium fuscum]